MKISRIENLQRNALKGSFMRKLTHRELVSRQQGLESEKVPLTVVLNDIRSLYNVGSIFRTADGAGVEKIVICGITGFPPDNMISKTALGAEETVPWVYQKDPVLAVSALKEAGYSVLLLEQTQNSTPYQDFQPSGPVALILGNEVDGVSDALVSLCDGAVDIEMSGLKNSLNVSVAFGIVAYHLRNALKKSKNPA